MRPILGKQSHKRIEKIRTDIMRFVELSRPEDSSVFTDVANGKIGNSLTEYSERMRESSLMRNPILGREVLINYLEISIR